MNYDGKILIVDDYSTMRKIIRNLLVQLGYTNIEEASNGNDALEKLRSGNYMLILSDWNMEPMTGLQLLKIVRADPNLRHIKFIMVTAESIVANIMAAKQAGVDNYIIKPFQSNTLRDKLNAVFGKEE